MKAIERAKTHFAEQDVKVIKVPEWGEEDKPLEIYSKPLTLSETSKLYRKIKSETSEIAASLCPTPMPALRLRMRTQQNQAAHLREPKSVTNLRCNNGTFTHELAVRN